jgi:hypothetical protein
MEDPRSVTAEHAKELWDKLEEARVRLWDKYTKQGTIIMVSLMHVCVCVSSDRTVMTVLRCVLCVTAGQRFMIENYDEIAKHQLLGDEEGLTEDELKEKLLRSPFARLMDPTSRKP